MRFAIYTSVISPHQIPLARAIIKWIGAPNYRYIYTETQSQERQDLGWGGDDIFDADLVLKSESSEAREWLENADALMIGDLRPLDLIARRAQKGLRTYYQTERWFKPPVGILRLLSPRYFRMARRFVGLLRSGDGFVCLPIGIHAACDMARLCGLLHGDIRCMFRAPKLDFERKPGGRISFSQSRAVAEKYCLDKMHIWGYYVAPSKFDVFPVREANRANPNGIEVLWVGRFLSLKRVDTIVRAVGAHEGLRRVDDSLPKMTLDLYGTGPEEARLKRLAAKYGDVVKFYPPVPISEVRGLMQKHDIYVLASNAYEGWGAVISEALEEGMKVVGTHEAGASASMLPYNCLFHAGNWKRLLRILQCDIEPVGIGLWTADYAAKTILEM